MLMKDTQWPRYEVFKQEKPGRPHDAVGTVHAPDGEMALQNARDVHVRRPTCHSLWVVPEPSIFKVTAEQLANLDRRLLTLQSDGPVETYQVFIKKTLRRSMVSVTHIGDVTASSATQALSLALSNSEWTKGSVYLWWIVPERSIVRSQDDDVLSMFEPVTRKTYKQQSRYGLVERNAQPSKAAHQ